MNYSIFSMQVVLPFSGPNDATYVNLHKLIRSAPERTHYAGMLDYYGRIANVLRREANRFTRGVWDYWDDPSRAPKDFQDWVDGLQGHEARVLPAVNDGAPRYLIATLAVLLQHGSTSDQRMVSHCNVPEERLWKRETFHHLLGGLKLLNFLHVQSDLVYVLPGDDAQLALTDEDLDTDDWHYLRPLE